MSGPRDIIDRLMDFDRCGTTALERVQLREQSAIEIAMLRGALERILKLNGGTHDLGDAQDVAQEELARSTQFRKRHEPSKLNSIDARLERLRGASRNPPARG